MKYFYCRVSTKEQNLERQLVVAREQFEIPDENVFCDKQSGKNFNRPEYERLKSVVQKGDEVIIKEFDRLGRNKAKAKEELEWFRQNGVILRILDIPTTLMDFKEQSWVLEMINNILIEVLATMAQQEYEKIIKRRTEGIEAMPIVDGRRVSAKTGRGIGRVREEVPCFDKYVRWVMDGEVTVTSACEELGISRAKWYRLIREVA